MVYHRGSYIKYLASGYCNSSGRIWYGVNVYNLLIILGRVMNGISHRQYDGLLIFSSSNMFLGQ